MYRVNDEINAPISKRARVAELAGHAALAKALARQRIARLIVGTFVFGLTTNFKLLLYLTLLAWVETNIERIADYPFDCSCMLYRCEYNLSKWARSTVLSSRSLRVCSRYRRFWVFQPIRSSHVQRRSQMLVCRHSRAQWSRSVSVCRNSAGARTRLHRWLRRSHTRSRLRAQVSFRSHTQFERTRLQREIETPINMLWPNKNCSISTYHKTPSQRLVCLFVFGTTSIASGKYSYT